VNEGLLKEGIRLARTHIARAQRDLECYDDGMEYFVKKVSNHLSVL